MPFASCAYRYIKLFTDIFVDDPWRGHCMRVVNSHGIGVVSMHAQAVMHDGAAYASTDMPTGVIR